MLYWTSALQVLSFRPIIPRVCLSQVCFLISLTYWSRNNAPSASRRSSYLVSHCLLALVSVISWTILISSSVEVVSSGCEVLMCPSLFFFLFHRAVDVDKAKILRTRDWMWASFDLRPLKMELLWKFILLLSVLVCAAGKPPRLHTKYVLFISLELRLWIVTWGCRRQGRAA